jgi:hypothetical protein
MVAQGFILNLRIKIDGHPVSARRLPPSPATHPQSAKNAPHHARQPDRQLFILQGLQVRHFVSIDANCFEVVCLRTCSDNILAWQSLTDSLLSSAFAASQGSALHDRLCQLIARKIVKIMDWVPVVLLTFKLLVLSTGMFFAIKWHYDQGKKEPDKEKEMRAVLRAGGKVAAVFVISLLVLVVCTFVLAGKLGLDLTFP